MLNCRILLLATTLLLLPPGVLAREPGEADRLFQSDKILEVQITAPIKTLLGERPNDRYLRGTLSYKEADDSVVDLDIGIRTRGNFRRQKDIRINILLQQ